MITVLTPAFNARPWIAETLHSLLAQGEVPLELILLDDGSTDGTGDLVRAEFPAVRVLSHANRGEAATVNRGVAEASNDLVAVVNADDPVLPGWAAAMAAAMARQELVAAYPDWRRIGPAGEVEAEIRTDDWNLETAFAQHYCIPGPGAVIRRSALAGEPMRDAARRTSSDYDLWLRLGLRGPLARVPEVLATWRRHPGGQSSAARGLGMAEDKIGTIRTFLARADLPAALRALGPQALSAAYVNAAMLGLRGQGIPAARYALLAYWHCPRWAPALRRQRRSLPHLLYAAAQPVSGALHRVASPLLPRRFSHAAMADERFGG